MNTYIKSLLVIVVLIVLVGCAQLDLEGNSSSKQESFEGLRVHFINVGQADATLFEYTADGEDYRILFDAGHWQEKDVVDYLQAYEIDHIDIMIGSHPHADHIGQMDSILETIDVSEVWLSGDVLSSQTFLNVMDAIEASEADYHEPRAGEVYDVGPLEVKVLNPDELTGDVHEGSISVLFSYGQTSFLLTGDAEEQTEQAMIDRGYDLGADVLKLGHHGSSTSTIPAFLQAVNPSVAIVSAGIDNDYGHPHREVVDRVIEADIELYATYEHGTIVIESDGETLQIVTEQDGDIERSNESASNEEEGTFSDCIDLNEASIDVLEEIAHIGAERAQALIELRPFETLDELTNIDGIGEGRLADIIEEGLACVR